MTIVKFMRNIILASDHVTPRNYREAKDLWWSFCGGIDN